MIGLQYVEQVQGQLIRALLRQNASGPITLAHYRRAHELHIKKLGATPHTAALGLPFMEVNHNRWTAICPECNSGITTGRLWKESRCFACGAVYPDTQWPVDLEAIEAVLLKRPVHARHWKISETISDLLIENVVNGRFTDLRRMLPPDVQRSLGPTPLLIGGKQ